MTKEEVILRRLGNQHLLAPGEKRTVVCQLCGVQAQFMSNAVHSLRIRCADISNADFGVGLVKNWTLRGTVHVFAEEDLPLFLHCGQDYRSNDWSKPSWWNQRSDWALTPERQAFLSALILEALQDGPMTREGLKAVCRGQGMTEPEEGSMFDPWGGGIRELCQRGFVNYVVQEEKAFCLAPEFVPMPQEEAELELARRYFTYYGPATVHDCQYFFRATAAKVKAWLARLPVVSAECGGKIYYFIENGNDFGASVPDCLFLAGFDPLMLGYEKKESLFLPPEHLRRVFNLAGTVMPTVLFQGKVVGTWKKKERKLEITLLEPLAEAKRSLILDNAVPIWPDVTKCEWK